MGCILSSADDWLHKSLMMISKAVIPLLGVLAFLFTSPVLSAFAEVSDPAASSTNGESTIPEGYNCIPCHKDLEDENLTPPVDEWMGSVHKEVGVRCDDCHGGDPFDEDLAMDPERGFTGKPSPENIPKLCAKCHADAKKMRAYRQRADQYSLYAGSVHGRKLLSGDLEAPSCVSCHGKHNILRVKDPQSSAFRGAVPETCGVCHSKEEIFKKRGKPFNQLALYKKSWHYEKFAEGNLLVPTCVDCHGNHGVVSPTSERVRTVCFNCHSSQAEFYKASPHWKAYKEGGEPICLNCHNYHDVTRPTVIKYTGDSDIDCVGCHEENGKAYQVGVDIQSVMISTISAFQEATGGMDYFLENAHGGFEVSNLKMQLKKTSEKLKELSTLTHKLDIEAIKKQAGDITKVAVGALNSIGEMRGEIRTRKIALVVAWVVFMVLGGVFWMRSKLLKRND